MRTSVVYPPKSAPALGFLKSSVNDVEIFVEDSASQNLWVKLLRNFLPEGVSFNSVTPMGSRSNVINACRADQVVDGRKKLYIIDGDFDFLQGRRKPSLKHLYRLRAYCVENYLVDEHGLVSLATLFETSITESAALAKLGFAKWVDDNERLLSALFICYAVANRLISYEATVSFSVHRLLKAGCSRKNVCGKRVSSRILYLYRKMIKECGSAVVRSEFIAVHVEYKKFGFLVSVSAKDYIMPQLFEIMKSEFSMSVRKSQFKVMLAERTHRRKDRYLAQRLAAIVNQS